MFCTKCGKQIDDSSKFCTACGAIVENKSNCTNQCDDVNNCEKTEKNACVVDKTPTDNSATKSKKNDLNKKQGFFAQLLHETIELFKQPKKLIPTFVLAVIWLVMPLITGFASGSNIPIVRFLCTITYANGGIFGGFFGTVGGIFGKAVFAAVVNSFVLSLCAKKNPFKGFKRGIGGVFKGGLNSISSLLSDAGIGLVAYWFFNITSAPQNSAIAVVSLIASLQAIGKQNGLLFGGAFYLLKRLSGGKAPSRMTVNRLMTGLSFGFTIAFGLTFLRYSWLIALCGILFLIIGVSFTVIEKNALKKTAVTGALAFMLIGAFLPIVVAPVHAADLPDNYVDPNSIEGFELGGDISNVDKYNGFYLQLESVQSYLLEYASYGFLGVANDNSLFDIKFNPVKVNLTKEGEVPSFSVYGNCKFTKQGENMGDELDYSDRTYVMDYSFNVTVTFERWEYYRALFKISGTESIKYDTGGGVPQEETLIIDGEVDSDNCIWQTDFNDSSKHYLHLYSNGLSRTGLQLSFRILGVRSGKKSGYLGGKTGSAKGEEGYVPYNGRLTYTSGITNKHGQPFPDIMDFNNDGYIDYDDLAIRQKLVHNPDYLDTPQGAILVLVSIFTTTIGIGAGTMAGALGSAVGTGSSLGGINIKVEFPEDEQNTTEQNTTKQNTTEQKSTEQKQYEDMVKQTDKYISTDEVGDLVVTDPITGAEKHYIKQENGNYRQVESGQNYTKDEIRNDLAYTQRNSDYFKDIESKRMDAQEYQREHVSDLSEDGKKMAEMMRQEKIEQAQQDRLNQIGHRHGVYSGDEKEIREKMAKDLAYEQSSNEKLHEIADNIDTVTTIAENTKKVADIAADVVSTADTTGVFKDVYSATTTAAGNAGEVIAGNMSVEQAIAKTAVDASTEVLKNRADTMVGKIVANVGGDAVQDATSAIVQGKDLDEIVDDAKKGAVRGLVDVTVDCTVNATLGGENGILSEAGENLTADVIKNSVPDIELPKDKK